MTQAASMRQRHTDLKPLAAKQAMFKCLLGMRLGAGDEVTAALLCKHAGVPIAHRGAALKLLNEWADMRLATVAMIGNVRTFQIIPLHAGAQPAPPAAVAMSDQDLVVAVTHSLLGKEAPQPQAREPIAQRPLIVYALRAAYEIMTMSSLVSCDLRSVERVVRERLNVADADWNSSRWSAAWGRGVTPVLTKRGLFFAGVFTASLVVAVDDAGGDCVQLADELISFRGRVQQFERKCQANTPSLLSEIEE